MAKAKQSTEKRAVLYIRVSTTEQADGPHTLDFQQKRCREYCDRHGLMIEKVFIDPGESARTVDRPEFQAMLRFCRDARNGVNVVVVQDISRFARNQQDRLQCLTTLLTSGVLLRSVNEPNVDESAAGQLLGNIMGGFAQYYSDALSERQKDGTRRMAQAGRFPWKAPLGYRNVNEDHRAMIVPDEQRSALVRRAFELFATGQYKASEVLRTVTAEGLRTEKGKELNKQRFQVLLRNPLYAGWITMPSDATFQPVKGLHQALVSQELFDSVQAILDGRKPAIAPRRQVNPAVPLRSLIKCASCGTSITGGEPKGRGGKTYPRYWCPNSSCLAVKLAKADFESAFVDLLRRLEPRSATRAHFIQIADDVWAEKQGDVAREIAKLSASLEEQNRLKFNMVKMRANGEISAEEFEAAKSEHAVETFAIEAKLDKAMSRRSEAQTFSRFAQLHLADLAELWIKAEPEQKVRVQKLLFGDGLSYRQGAGFFEPPNSTLFSILADMNAEKVRLVGPPGLEPGTNGL